MREKLESEMREMRENITRLQKMERVLEQEGEKLSQEKKLQEKLRVGRRKLLGWNIFSENYLFQKFYTTICFRKLMMKTMN